MKKISLLFLSLFTLVISCKNNKNSSTNDHSSNITQSTDMNNDWITLFNGENLNAWKPYNGDMIAHWNIQRDVHDLTPQVGESENLITKAEFTDFILPRIENIQGWEQWNYVGSEAD